MSSSQGQGEPPARDEAADREKPLETAAPETDAAPTARRPSHHRLHGWIPLGIAVVSVLAALMGWRAALVDEDATRTEELSRQALVQQQQLLVQDNQAINADLRTFGQFAQYSALAHSLLQDSGSVGGSAADELRTEGQADLGIARYLGKQIEYQNYAFDPSSPSGNPVLRPDGTYLPGHPYDAAAALAAAQNGDTALHGLAPEQLHDDAVSERTDGVDLIGIAALFVGVIVLLTLATVVSGAAKVLLAASGAVLSVVGVFLAILVEVS
jgi:hypothetical protein